MLTIVDKVFWNLGAKSFTHKELKSKTKDIITKKK